MSENKKTAYVTRDSIQKLLSHDELAKVSSAEGAPRLADGDEFIDLEDLDKGVQRAPAKSTPMGRVLPKKAVHADTWARIVAQLSSHA